MDYIVLSRKWRPEDFDQVVGQEHVTKILLNALLTGKISHSYLFSGPRGVGKTTVARILAKKINNFKDIDSSLDIIELDGASNRGIDEIRDLKDSIQYVPTSGKYKVFIIDEAHMLTKEAFNALLKTLEEPPAHAVFILATTEIQKIPPTISSRCQKYEFKKISSLDISDHLKSVLNKEGYKVEKEALKLIALKADGSLRDALSLADKVITLCDRDISYDITAKVLGVVPQELYLELLNKIVSKDLKSCLKAINKVMDSGISNSNFLEGFVGYLRDSICYIILYREDLNLSQESAAFLDSEKLDAEGLNRLLNLSLDCINSYVSISNIELENLFFKFFDLRLSDSLNKSKPKTLNVLDQKEIKEQGLSQNTNKLEGKYRDLNDAYKDVLKRIEKENIGLYCVLEKVKAKQVDSLILSIDFSDLSKYDENILLENVGRINATLSSLYNQKTQIKLNEIKKIDKSKAEGRSEEDENPADQEEPEDIESREHPLIDIAINDYNGKIIK